MRNEEKLARAAWSGLPAFSNWMISHTGSTRTSGRKFYRFSRAGVGVADWKTAPRNDYDMFVQQIEAHLLADRIDAWA